MKMGADLWLRIMKPVGEGSGITRKLVGVSRGDSSVGPTGVGGGLEAWVPCRGGGAQT